MDAKVIERMMKQWIPIFEAQAQSGIGKEKWCDVNGIKRWEFFKWQREIRKYLLDQNTAEPEATAECLPAETGFVDITPASVSSPAVVGDEPETVASTYGHATDPVSSINIRYGGFTIDLSGGIDKKLLSAVLEVIRDVN